jgi:hypothetical protein
MMKRFEVDGYGGLGPPFLFAVMFETGEGRKNQAEI